MYGCFSFCLVTCKCNITLIEHNVSVTEDCYICGKLLDHTDCKIILDTVGSKSFTSKTFYLNCPLLCSLPKFVSRIKKILVDNGHYVDVLFVIPVAISPCGYRFEVYTLVSEIHHNVGHGNRSEKCACSRRSNQY